MYSFFEIFQVPQKYLNLQESKGHQNGLNILQIDCILQSQTNSVKPIHLCCEWGSSFKVSIICLKLTQKFEKI